ncbi:2',5'-phosphodiesterase 12 [Chionoecetes opilio]|uniref:2',5'-phosphodiesterase 12 n=1 Tax=Chionoecetes opilio TaxID=41210 RepID=A0A8J5CBH1_CHIOP|nr:2',5'-phosphodiesterase 12 [Chionoecetes opilio]
MSVCHLEAGVPCQYVTLEAGVPCQYVTLKQGSMSVFTLEAGVPMSVVVRPRQGQRQGEDTEARATVLVSAGPGHCPFQRRHEATKHQAGQNCLRVISYNILADQYADSEFARSTLFPSCPTYAIDMDYRKQLLLKEISGYNGDLVCLQEVDEKMFLRDLKHTLRTEGLEGVYTAKGGTVTEGVALFYRLAKLRLLESQRFILSEELQNNVMFADMWTQIQGCQDLKEKVMNRFTALQVSVLESVQHPGQVLVVGITHLYFHPDADHIRLLQAGLSLQILRQVMALYQNKYPEKEVSLLFTGDFNSTPEFEVYRLMTSQMAGFDDVDWTDKENERVSGVSFSHDLELASACGCPPYTNYVKGFHGCLDYVFYQTDKFSVKQVLSSASPQVVALPSHEEVTQHQYLPSITIPSDHLAIIADLEFKRQ